jgi:hypothetical protein
MKLTKGSIFQAAHVAATQSSKDKSSLASSDKANSTSAMSYEREDVCPKCNQAMSRAILADIAATPVHFCLTCRVSALQKG